MPEGAEEENNDPDEDTADDSTDPHKALAQIKFDEFIQQEKTLKSINELSLKEKPTKSSRSKSKETASRDENGVKSKKKKKTKDKEKERDGKEHKKSKKSRREKKEDNEENAIGKTVESTVWIASISFDFKLISLSLSLQTNKTNSNLFMARK